MKRAGMCMIGALIIITVIGSILTFSAMDERSRLIHNNLMAHSRLAAMNINVSQVQALTGTEADLVSQDYISLKQLLIEERKAFGKARFVYILGQWPNGTLFIYIDSDPPTSVDYSPPGQAYYEASDAYGQAFAGKSLTAGPLSDRWGTWLTAMIPLREPSPGGRVVAVFAVDIESADWVRQMVLAGLTPALASLLMCIVLIISYLIHGREEDEKQRLAESAHILQRSEEKFRSLIENSHDIIFTISPDGIFTFISPSWTTLLGHPVALVVGKSFLQFVHPDDKVRCQECLQRSTETGQRQTGIEFRVQHADGSWRWHISNGVPLLDETGRIVGFEGSTSDITARKLAEEALAESERQYRDLFESSHDAIMTLEPPSWKFTSCNQATLKLFKANSEKEFLSLSPWDVSPERQPDGSESCEMGKDMIAAALRNGSHFFEWMHKQIDGTEFPASLLLTRMYHNDIVFLQATIRDITEHKKAEEAIRETNQKLRLLTGLTRHDIFNQLSVVNGSLDLAIDESDPATVHEFISLAREACERIETIIGFTRKYENFGTVSSGWQRIKPMITSAKVEVRLGKITIDNQIPGNLEVYADPIIRKVFSTLIENAIRHGEEVTIIRFFCSEKDDTLIITCEDDGVGIPTDEKEYIFDHGYGKNTGIGLFLASEILSITRLSIRECGVPGKGARFEILVAAGKFRIHREEGQ